MMHGNTKIKYETVSTDNRHTALGGYSVCGVTPLPSTHTKAYCVTLTFYFHNPYTA